MNERRAFENSPEVVADARRFVTERLGAVSPEIARKVLLKHLQSGNSYGIQLKPIHTKFPQPQLGSWTEGSPTVGADWKPAQLEGWTPKAH